jgi:beta-lactamase class A
MGDKQTRLDRYETALNLVPAGEARDSTTPRAMASTVAHVMSGKYLSSDQAMRLRAWMIATETGKRRLRAGLPAHWVAGDKTGTAAAATMPNKHNDVAVIWPLNRAPIVIAAYLDASGHFESTRPEEDEVLASVGRVVAQWIEQA